jgi:hypothetical protein
MPVARDPWVRELHYRRFSKGVQEMSIFTHDDYVALIQQYPYVIGRSAALQLQALFIFLCSNPIPATGQLTPHTVTLLPVLLCRKQAVIKDKKIESTMVKSFVCLRNICRVMKLPVVLDADRLELEVETELLGSLLTILLGALREKNAATFAAFAVVVDASNGLDAAQIVASGAGAEADAESEAEAGAEADRAGVAALKPKATLKKKRSAGAAVVVASGSDATTIVLPVATGAVAGKRKRRVEDAADETGEVAAAAAAAAGGPAGASGRVAKKRKMKYINIPKVNNSTFR